MTTPNLPGGVSQFVGRIETWLAEQPESLQLFTENAPVLAGEKDVNDVIAAAADWSLSLAERRVWEASSIAYEPVQKPLVDGDTFQTGVGIEVRGVSYFVAHAREPDAYSPTDKGVAITHEEATHFTEVELRSAALGAQLSTIKEGLRSFSPVTQDVLALLLANALSNQPDSRGYYIVEVESILAARGLEQKKKGKYTSGHHLEARVAVVEAMRDLSRLYVATDPITKRFRRLRNWDSVLKIDRFQTYDAAGDQKLVNLDQLDPTKVASIRYGFGEWFETVKSYQFPAPKSVLALDAQRETTAKKIGHYFVQRAHEADAQGRVIRSIRQLMREAVIKPEPSNPQRTRTRLESAFAKLVTIQAFHSWGYRNIEAEKALPLYRWLEPWLDLEVWVRLGHGGVVLPP